MMRLNVPGPRIGSFVSGENPSTLTRNSLHKQGTVGRLVSESRAVRKAKPVLGQEQPKPATYDLGLEPEPIRGCTIGIIDGDTIKVLSGEKQQIPGSTRLR